MNRQLLFVIVSVVLSSGCEVKPPPPSTSSHNAANQLASGASPASPSEQPAGNGNREQQGVNPSEQQQYVSFPGAGIQLIRPQGFDDAERFYGFQQPNTQASVMAVMIPGPFAEVTRGFTAEQLQPRGMTLRSKDNVVIEGKAAVLLSVTQSALGKDFGKWILAFGDETKTIMVTATYPQSEEAKLADELKAVVLGTRFDNTPPPAPGADLGFAITASSKLKPTRSIGKILLYTKDGVTPAKSPEDPIFIAAPSVAKVPIDNKRQFAMNRLFQTVNTKVGSVTSNSEITVDGLDGYEILADAENADNGTPLRIYQVVLYEDGSYILMQGLVGADAADEYLPEFRRMAHSLSRSAR